jgi:4-hydroxy-tetrahydrodipicolinate reductase
VKVALIGNGKMGRTISSLQEKMNFKVVEIYDEDTPFLSANSSKADVAIDFTLPFLAANHIKHSVKIKLPIVMGTTGWYDHFPEVSNFVAQQQGTLFYATNFSIGVNLFFAVNRKLASLMNHHDAYNVSVSEIHHTEKKDAPSGTAITLAEQTTELMTRIEEYRLVDHEYVDFTEPHIIPIKAYREHDVPGTHEIVYQSEIDSIKISHIANNRLGFAMGAVEAAKFTQNKTGVFTMKDLLNF